MEKSWKDDGTCKISKKLCCFVISLGILTFFPLKGSKFVSFFVGVKKFSISKQGPHFPIFYGKMSGMQNLSREMVMENQIQSWKTFFANSVGILIHSNNGILLVKIKAILLNLVS